MKKLFLLLALAVAPFMFWSCDDNDLTDELTGTIKFTLENQAFHYTGAVMTERAGKCIVATGSSEGAVTITLEGSAVGTYRLGVGQSMDAITNFISGGLNYEDLSNTVVFYPFGGDEKYMIVGGTCNVTSSSSTKVKGTFSGVAISINNLSSLNATSLWSIITGDANMVGEFTAYKL